MMSIADSPRTRNLLSTIKESYQTYQTLFQEELKFLKAGRTHSHNGLNREKEKATQSIIDGLETLRTDTSKNATDKIRSLHEIGTKLRRIAMMMTAAFLIFGIVISLLINRSITQPLSILEKRPRILGRVISKRISILPRLRNWQGWQVLLISCAAS